MDFLQPPDSPGVGRCLRCASSIEESEQVGGICYECQPAEQGEQPAFPVQASDYGGHGTCFGLTIRDYLAAKAMQALIASAGSNMALRTDVASHAYGFADDMLAVRVKP